MHTPGFSDVFHDHLVEKVCEVKGWPQLTIGVRNIKLMGKALN